MKRVSIAAALLLACCFTEAVDGLNSDPGGRPSLEFPGYTTAIAYSSSLHRLAVAYDWGRSIRVFDDDGDLISESRTEYANLSNSLSFLGHQPVLVEPATESGSDVAGAMLSFRNANSGAFLRYIPGPVANGAWQVNRARAFAITGDGKYIVASTGSGRDSRLVLVDVGRGKQTVIVSSGTVSSPADTFESVDFAPDGSSMAVGTAGSKLILLRSSLDAEPRIIEPFPDPMPPVVLAVRFNPASSLLAVGADQPITPGPTAHPRHEPPLHYHVGLWEVSTGKLRTALPDRLAPVRQLAWSPNGRLLAIAAGDQTVRVWDTATRSPTPLTTFRTSDSAMGLVFESDSLLAVAVGVEVMLLTVKSEDGERG